MRQTQHNQQRRREQRGFSLNEALISLTVLTSGLLTLAQFQGDLHENRRQTKAQTTAINLVLDKVEELRDLAASGESLQDGEDVPAERPGDSTRFARSWTIRAGAQPGIDEVRVIARWEGGKGKVQTTGLRTFIAP
jgi:Tfp pilus assembly protein PilV